MAQNLPSAIKALPPATVRRIRTSQVLVDPCSVVKELIYNALDARVTSVFVDITANTVDLLQAKDNGHGIPAEDHPLDRWCVEYIITNKLKERLRKANPDLPRVKDPFFSMNITCPPSSYDSNVEPAKDDVLFADGNLVLKAVEKLLEASYLEATRHDPPISTQPYREQHDGGISSDTQLRASVAQKTRPDERENVGLSPQDPRIWASNMSSIEEEDLLAEALLPCIDEDLGEEAEHGAASLDNPWTIAKMNAPLRRRPPASNIQLMTPAKSRKGATNWSSSPLLSHTIHPGLLSRTEPLTPETVSRSPELRLQIHEDNIDESQVERTAFPRQRSDSSRSRLTRSTGSKMFQSNQKRTVQSKKNPNPPFASPLILSHNDSGVGNPTPKLNNFNAPPRKNQRQQRSFLTQAGPSDLHSAARNTAEDHVRGLHTQNSTDIRSFFREREPTPNLSHSPEPLEHAPSTSPLVIRPPRSQRTRTRSYKRALSFTPLSHLAQNIILTVSAPMTSIVQSTRKVDMGRNGVEWGVAVEDGYDDFPMEITQERMRVWCRRVDGLLHGLFGGVDGVDAAGVLKRRVWEAFGDVDE
ncbi:hypothetical protein EJ04DRAFT_580858 [Polyplosphaeria fusca]|uniref:DNA mismatch repair protein S5 domain-containing protein n=1 Tax=Polyplosphaeria fusca TaxID=682080 RepID=A0A9P4UXQ3_9PLEO|nr:hypothetical protein EJ04DRAFT_580858 [Polyplosphaeria fusca]